LEERFFIAVFDCAGIYQEKPDLDGNNEISWIGAKIVLVNDQRHLMVQGNKRLEFPDPLSPDDAPELHSYPLQESKQVQRRQLPSGAFTQYIPVPNTFKAEIFKTVILDGKYSVSIEKEPNLKNVSAAK
jgi:hypothetical protein